MNIDNINTWIAELRTTTHGQAYGKLCLMHSTSDGAVKDFCCLGLGSTLVPGMEITWPSEESQGIFQPYTYAPMFGKGRQSGLAPYEFIEWLGLDVMDPKQYLNTYIVRFDFPDNMRTRSGSHLRDMGAHQFNDAGFTFSQIADLIEHFGLQPVGLTY